MIVEWENELNCVKGLVCQCPNYVLGVGGLEYWGSGWWAEPVLSLVCQGQGAADVIPRDTHGRSLEKVRGVRLTLG